MLTPLGFSLLRQLADGEFHSGEDLAEKVGLTRARVSQVLKDAGTAGLARAQDAQSAEEARLLEYGKDIFLIGGTDKRVLAAPGAPGLQLEIKHDVVFFGKLENFL